MAGVHGLGRAARLLVPHRQIVARGDSAALRRVTALAVIALVFAAVAAPIGSLAQAVAVMCGLSLSRRPPEQTADYDDQLLSPPPTG